MMPETDRKCLTNTLNVFHLMAEQNYDGESEPVFSKVQFDDLFTK